VGDWNKLIVSCTVKGAIKEELKKKIEDLDLSASAYQSQEQVISLQPNDWDDGEKNLSVVLIGQTKWGRGQREFCEWLRPHVLQGSGLSDIYAFSFSEHADEPEVWAMAAESLEHPL
jgi:hypothetical protein